MKVIQIWDHKNGIWKEKILQDDEVDEFETTSVPLERNNTISDYENSIEDIEKTKIIYSLGYKNYNKEKN